MQLTLIHSSPFYELTALLALAAFIGLIGNFLRQPMIVSYIVVGILAGPSLLGIVESKDSIEQLAELSIAVLLFLVGMKLDLSKIRTLGPVSLLTGIGQVFFTAFFGFFILLALGFDWVASIYVATALTFSSTIIIVKLLSDKKEVDSLHGRVAIGFLIVQDLVVVVVMLILSVFGGELHETSHVSPLFKLAFLTGYLALMLGVLYFFIIFLATPLINRVIHSPELVVTFAISWAALFAAMGAFFGFSKELGGLLAGASLASTPFRESIASRLSPLRDFLLLFFFVSLGSQINLSELTFQVVPAVVLSLFVLLGNPLIVMIIMGYMGFRKRTGLLAGLTVAQISEFSLIFIALGLSLGHISQEALSLVTLVGLITIGTSIYMILYSHEIYDILEPYLNIFERHVPHREQANNEENRQYDYEMILFGLGRYGMELLHLLKNKNISVLGVDYDPAVVKKCNDHGFPAIYGDIWDQMFFLSLSLAKVRWVISTVPQHDFGIGEEDPRLLLMDMLKREKFKGKVAVAANHQNEASLMETKGADLVFLPFHDAAVRAVERIEEMDLNNDVKIS